MNAQMSHPEDLVRLFHELTGLPARIEPIRDEDYDPAEIEFRKTLVNEECRELIEALDELRLDNSEERRMNVLKEVCDVVYVAFGTTVQLGLKGREGFSEVSVSNLSKIPACPACEGFSTIPGENCLACSGTGFGEPIRRESDGKILKPETYSPPSLKGLA